MERKTLMKLKELSCKELDEIARKDKLSMSDLEIVDKLSHTYKNLQKIEMEEGNSQRSYSQDGSWEARGSYDGGNSYGRYSRNSYDGGSNGNSYDGYAQARNGSHYVGGHYSMAAESEMEKIIEEKLHDPNIGMNDKEIIRRAKQILNQ